MPRVLTLAADTSLPEAMRAFRLTRNEFAVVIAESGFETYGAPASPPPPTGINGDDASGWHAQTILAEVWHACGRSCRRHGGGGGGLERALRVCLL